ncbi:hypothetical protein I5G90_gp04 [Mycobacterium phage Adonis]|uniref:Uncharacterized protein n=1 Tax=Mycobacterium phage Adonis TaxID=2108121 RepID=A0A2P1JS24_9CAUD|nr:hypothetical protein I5G90_gp04 [Mycobacterium phage Adonis]AVO21943.1 hypothetical protein PBI_ADONIS_4 [Mycobacterium phage Adonis]USH45918.1 hypothetical protein SEA_TIRI_4 [Mycobacterium phage Tiri]
MIPTVGRIVHYQSYGTPGGEFLPEPRAAIVTEVHDEHMGTVALCVLNPTGMYFNQCVEYAGDEPTPGCWNWPPRN